jgi:ABC-2 type transport system permease protein
MSGAVRWWRAIADELAGVLAIAGRELRALFVTPLGYAVATAFLLLQGWNFALLLRVLNDPLAAPGPVFQFYFGGSFFIFWLPVIIVCATATMGLVAEERRQGTLEALLSTRIRPRQIIAGKYLGALGFYGLLWAPTGVFVLQLRAAGVAPDPGPVLAGYLGAGLVGATFIAFGLLASTVAATQLGAAVTTAVGCTIAVVAGLLVGQTGLPGVDAALAATSLLAMMQELAQGIVDLRWVALHTAIVGSCLAVAATAVDPRRSGEQLVQRALTLVTLAALAAVASRHAPRADWTGGAVYSLSERARAVLGELPRTAEITVVMPAVAGGGRPNPLEGELREVLRRMEAAAPRLRVRFVDPDRERQTAEQLVVEYGLTGRTLADGVVLVRAGQAAQLRRKWLLPGALVTWSTAADVQVAGPRVKEFRGEEALLRALIEVTDPVRRTACATVGHGEPPWDGLEPYGGYAHLAELIDDLGFRRATADLTREDGLAGCDVLVVAGPRDPLSADEAARVRAFAEAGGDLLLLTGAVLVRGSPELQRHGLEGLAAAYGVGFTAKIALDPHVTPGASPLVAFTVVDGWGDHPIAAPFVQRPVSFVFARALTLDATRGATALVSTSGEGWAEADIAGLQQGELPEPDGDGDEAGPIVVAAAGVQGGSRLVVIASDQLALNAALRADVAFDHGRDLIATSLGWLVERPALAGVRARPREHVKLVLLPEQLRRMTWMSVLGLPAFAALLGLIVLGGRRR